MAWVSCDIMLSLLEEFCCVCDGVKYCIQEGLIRPIFTTSIYTVCARSGRGSGASADRGFCNCARAILNRG